MDVESKHKEEGHNKDFNTKASSGGSKESSNRSNSSNTSGLSTTETDDITETRNKAAEDSTTFQPVEQTSTDYGTGTKNTTATTSASGDVQKGNSSNWNSENAAGNSEHDITITEHRFGNQGVTMSQDMVFAEYNVRYFNLYEKMADVFVNEFCICIYN